MPAVQPLPHETKDHDHGRDCATSSVDAAALASFAKSTTAAIASTTSYASTATIATTLAIPVAGAAFATVTLMPSCRERMLTGTGARWAAMRVQLLLEPRVR